MRSLFKQKSFLIGLALKLILMSILASQLFTDYFIPFLDFYSKNPFKNPWAYFGPEKFPYGSVLLMIMSLPKIMFNLISPWEISGTHPLNMFIYKLPILICDILCLKALNLITSFKLKKSLLFYYWFNPILIYICYVHCQLDVVSMMFLFFSLALLARNSWALSSLFFSMAILSKFHVVIILPLILAYIWNKVFLPKSIKVISIYLLLCLCITLVGFYPHMHAGYFSYVTTSSPQAKSILGGFINYGPDKVLLLGVLLLFLGTLRVVFATSISLMGLIFGAGFLMNILLVSTNFAPGWFFWIVPFYALAYSVHKSLPRGLFYLFGLSFFIYFGLPEFFIPGLIQRGDVYTSLSFTLLQSFLILYLVITYLNLVKQELPIKRRLLPFMIGISGDSGSGKNYISDVQSKIFPSRNKVIEGDDYHRWERSDSNWERYTHLNPLANHLHLMAEHARQLVGGSTIFNRHYNHQTGTFSEEREIAPAKIIFFQGLHTLYLKKSRDFFDIKIFCRPDPILKLYWKLQRDTKERGHSREKVLSSFEKRQSDSMEHIESQLKYADWIVETSTIQKLDRESVLNDTVTLPLELKYRHVLYNVSPVFDIVEYFSLKTSGDFQILISEIDTERLVLEFQGKIGSEVIREAALALFPDLRSLTRSRKEPQWLSNNEGITQLITLALLSHKKG